MAEHREVALWPFPCIHPEHSLCRTEELAAGGAGPRGCPRPGLRSWGACSPGWPDPQAHQRQEQVLEQCLRSRARNNQLRPEAPGGWF